MSASSIDASSRWETLVAARPQELHPGDLQRFTQTCYGLPSLVVVDEDAKLQQIGQLGHELRNALTSVLAAAEIVRHRCGESVEIEHEVITRQVRRMRKLVDEMLVLTGRKQ